MCKTESRNVNSNELWINKCMCNFPDEYISELKNAICTLLGIIKDCHPDLGFEEFENLIGKDRYK